MARCKTCKGKVVVVPKLIYDRGIVMPRRIETPRNRKRARASTSDPALAQSKSG